MPRDWSRDEVDATVADYFEMLAAELAGAPYSKAEHRRGLQTRLDGRTKGAVEFKHGNISAVLCQMGLPYIIGYKPAPHYQGLLADAVHEVVRARAHDVTGWVRSFLKRPVSQSPPAEVDVPRLPKADPRLHPPHIHPMAFSDAERAKLGQVGEAIMYEVERDRVRARLGSALADRVVWASKTEGDGLGYDIRSFDVEAAEQSGAPARLLVEVKTTTQGAVFPFYMSENERRVAWEAADRYVVRRLFDVYRKPRFFSLRGPALRECRLEPTAYRVHLPS